jgi:hypothetical protein
MAERAVRADHVALVQVEPRHGEPGARARGLLVLRDRLQDEIPALLQLPGPLLRLFAGECALGVSDRRWFSATLGPEVMVPARLGGADASQSAVAAECAAS